MNNRIEIDGTYFIDIDELNWILKKRVKVADRRRDGKPSKNAGKTYEKVIGYFGNLSHALTSYANCREMDEIVQCDEPVSVGKLLNVLESIETLCKNMKLTKTEVKKHGRNN